MSEQSFKSPNFYEREIDLSSPRVTGPVGVPGAIIGTSNKGPAFVPVTVANFSEFTNIFGNLDPMHAGPYAANEFLKNKTALTYLRVLGAGANSTAADVSNTLLKGTVVNAGFTRLGTSGSAHSADKRHRGAVQFLAATHTLGAHEGTSVAYFTDNDTTLGASSVNLVRGMIMTPDTSRVYVTSETNITPSFFSTPTSVNDDFTMGSTGKFKIIISSSLGSNFSASDGIPGLLILTASFDPTSKDYFGKVLNSDPDKFYTNQHYLHADLAVDVPVAYVASNAHVALLSGSANTSTSSGDPNLTFREVFGKYDTRYTTPATSFFISQPFGAVEHDLFKFEAIDDGEYANSLYKISITNVKASLNDSYKFGTFNVQIRDWKDTDLNPVVIEQFSNCSLDPSSPNYVAKMIGDRKVSYNFDTDVTSEKRLFASGKYSNNSKYVRIVMNEDVELGKIPTNALPFGFRGPEILNINPLLAASDSLSAVNARLGGQLSTAALSLTSSFLPPVPHRFKVTRGEVTGSNFLGQPGPSEQANPTFYWGVKFERSSTSSDPSADNRVILNNNVITEKNELLHSYTKFCGIRKLDALVTGSSVDSLNNNKFSLSKVAFYNSDISHLTASINTHMKEAAYIRNAKVDTTTYNVKDPLSSQTRITLASLLAQGTAPQFNRFSTFTKFTNFMYGGFDGTNFLNRDARRLNDKSVSFDSPGGASGANAAVPLGFSSNPSGEGPDNNGVTSYLTAVDIVTNPMEANNNLLAIPGIKEPYVNDQAAKKVKNYGLAMYVMDVPGYDDDQERLYDDSTKKPNIKNTAALFDGRSIDNDYAAAYFPDVFLDDSTNRRKVKVPASVAALGALGFNDRIAYPWFAPAGFNRAALDFVTNVDVRLNVADRDRLYESRINPIATFPRLGYVIYGQKTLKINKSALDRVNVRRLMLELKRIIVGIAQRIVFEQNTPAVRNKFVADASFQLGLVQLQAGIEAFQVIMNESNNTQDDVDLNRLNGRIVVIPTRVVEFIAIDFIITNAGVEFV